MSRRGPQQGLASAALARSRPVAATACLSLHRARQTAICEERLVREPPILLLAVPKRLLSRAVDRNSLRRLAREHWRVGTIAASGAGVWMLKLRALPSGYFDNTKAWQRRFWHAQLVSLLDRALQAVSVPGVARVADFAAA